MLLATGGAGQLFAQTTNPVRCHRRRPGPRLARRSRRGGPRVLPVPPHLHGPAGPRRPAKPKPSNQDPLLISEAVRGEGAILVDAHGPPVHARLPPRRRTRPAGRRFPQHCPAPGRARRPQRPRLPRRPRHRGRQGSRASWPSGSPPSRAAPARPASTGPGNSSPSPRPRTTGWAASPPTCTAAPPFPGSSPPAKSPAPESRAPTGWPATRSSKGWSSGGGLLKRSLCDRRTSAAVVRTAPLRVLSRPLAAVPIDARFRGTASEDSRRLVRARGGSAGRRRFVWGCLPSPGRFRGVPCGG